MAKTEYIESVQLLGKSDAMQDLYKLIGRLCNADCAVLLMGAEGTGRGVIARGLHYFSHRAGYPFITLDGTEITESSDEDLLGLDESHHTEATCFVTNFTSIPSFTQHQLLSLHRTRQFRCSHENRVKEHNLRFVIAAGDELKQDLQSGALPLDLFYDWNFVTVQVPSLNDRKTDIPIYAAHFLTNVAQEMKVSAKELSPEAVELLMAHDWPGNLKELKSVMKVALSNCRGNYIRAEHLPEFRKPSSVEEAFSRLESFLDSRLSSYIQSSLYSLDGNLYRLLLNHVEKSLFDYALKKSDGNKNKAAQLLGLHRNTLNKKLQKFPD